MKNVISATVAAVCYCAYVILLVLGAFVGSLLFNGYVGIIVGLALIVPAVVFHILGKKTAPLAFLPIVLNGFGSGLIAGGYYTHISATPSLAGCLIGAGFVCFVILVGLLVYRFTGSRGAVEAASALLSIALIILFAVLWGVQGGVVYPMLFFCSLVIPLYTIVFHSCTTGDDPAIEQASFWSFIVVLSVFLVVIVAIGGDCDCDCSGCDGGCDCGGTKKRKKP